MAWPVVIATNGYGIPVTESSLASATPYEIASNGYGTPVVFVASGGLPVREGGAWYAGVFDMDVENVRFYWNGATYASEAALLTAISGSKTVGARTIGPYVFGTEKMSDPGFDSGVSGVADGPTSAANGTPSAAGGQLTLTMTGVGNNYRARASLGSLTARRAYYAEAQMASHAGLDAASLALSNNTDLGGAAGATYTLGSLPQTVGVVFGNPAATMYAGFNITDAGLTGVGVWNGLSVKECSPFNGFVQEAVAGYVDFVAPSTFGSTKVVFELGDDALTRERIRIEIGSAGAAQFIVTNDGAAQAAISLGTLTVSTRYRVDFSCGPNRIVAKIGSSASVADVSASVPGLGKLFIGRSTSGETLDTGADLIKRVRLYPYEYLPSDAVWGVGDSYMDGAAGVSLPVTANADSRAMIETSSGGTTLAQQYAEMQLYPGLCASGVFIHWDGDANGYTDVPTQMATYASMIALLGHNRFLIVSPLKRANKAAGDNTFTGDLQAALAAAYPANYIDAQAILATHATSPGDDSMVAAGQVPDSLLQADDTHLTSAAMGFVWADATVGIKSVLAAKGW